MSAPAFGVVNKLGLGVDWEPQNSSPASAGTRVKVNGPDGDQVASNVHNTIESGSQAFIYVGAEVDFAAAFLAAACNVGQLVATDTLMILGIAVDFSPCAAGKRPLVNFTWRDGPTAAPTTPFSYLTTLTLPTYVAANIVVPEILTMTVGDAELQNIQWSIGAQFGPDLDKDGEYLAGQVFDGEETLALTFVGTPTSVTSTGWDQTTGPGATTGEQASNTGYGQTSYGFSRGVTRT